MRYLFPILLLLPALCFAGIFKQGHEPQPFMAEIDGLMQIYNTGLHDNLNEPILPLAAQFHGGVLSLSQVSPFAMVLAASPEAFRQTNASDPAFFYERAMSMLKAPMLVLAGLQDKINLHIDVAKADQTTSTDLNDEADYLLAHYFSRHQQKAGESDALYYSRCATDIARQVLSMAGMSRLQISELFHLSSGNNHATILNDEGMPSLARLTKLVKTQMYRVAVEKYRPCLENYFAQSGPSENFFAQFESLQPGFIECDYLQELARLLQPSYHDTWALFLQNSVSTLLRWPHVQSNYQICQVHAREQCSF